MKEVTDPALLAQLNGSSGGKEVTDSALLAQCGGATPTPPAQPPQNMAAFVGGNLSKGVADVAGLPVDLASSAIEGVKGVANKFGANLKETQAPVGGSEWIKQKLSQNGSIYLMCKTRNESH